jgi:DNA-binding NtrC family response regulator
MNEGGPVTPDMLPDIVADEPGLAPPPALLSPTFPEPAMDALIGKPLAEIERLVIEATLRRFDGSVPKAARVLELAPSTLYRKIDSWKD